MDDESAIRTKLRFQDVYIKILESELFNLIGEKELGIYKEEQDPTNNVSIFLKSKIEAIYQSSLELQRKFDKINNHSYDCPLTFKIEVPSIPPPTYNLSRIATISEEPLDVFKKQVILRWKCGKNQMGNALYMDDKCIIDMATVGYLIDKFFHEVCRSKINLLKGKK